EREHGEQRVLPEQRTREQIHDEAADRGEHEPGGRVAPREREREHDEQREIGTERRGQERRERALEHRDAEHEREDRGGPLHEPPFFAFFALFAAGAGSAPGSGWSPPSVAVSSSIGWLRRCLS